MNRIVAIVAGVALVVLIWLTLQFGPGPTESVDTTKPPAINPLQAAGPGSGSGATVEGADEGGGQTDGSASAAIPAAIAEQPWLIDQPFTPLLEPQAPPPPIAIETIDRASARTSGVADDAAVIGIVVDGQARAYDVAMFGQDTSSVVNDTVGGVPVAVSFCRHSGSILAVRRQSGGKELTLADTGAVWRGNILLRDLETDSRWCQLLARAVSGELVEQSLVAIPVTVTTWSAWTRLHAESTLTRQEGGGPVDENEFRNVTSDDDEFGIGLFANGAREFYSLAELIRSPVRSVETGGVPITVAYFPGSGVVGTYLRSSRMQDFLFNEQGFFDDRVAGTTWDLATGKAVGGRQAGSELTRLRFQWCTRKGWQAFFAEAASTDQR